MDFLRFSDTSAFYRGNLHGHCTHSDGLMTAEEIACVYRNMGYDFTCLSDHLHTNTRFASPIVNDTSALNRDDFITINSAEMHCNGKAYDKDGLWHILANGLPTDFAHAGEDETAPEMVQRALDAGAFVSIAHPEWYSLTMAEAESIAHAHAVEIYNHSCALDSGRGGGVAVIDYLLNEGHGHGIIATDDSHNGVYDVGGGWVMVAADKLDAGCIISALKAGNYYASSGAEIRSIRLEGNMLEVRTSPSQAIILAGARHLAEHCNGASLTKAMFDLSRFNSPWFRIVVMDHGGGNAWSNAFFMDDLKNG